MENLISMMLGFALLFLLIIIVVYLIESILLNKLNKIMYGKGTLMAWLPIFNIYLLGKLTINKTFGWILVACVFLTSEYTTTINGVEKSYSILPGNISSVVSSIYLITVFVLFIYAIVKYNKLKKQIKNQVLGKVKEDCEESVYDNKSNDFCPKCGFKLARNAKFCMRCGKHF